MPYCNVMHHFIRFAVGYVLLLALPLAACEADQPNIILILVDDMGFSDIGCYGGEINTPNIDALAAGGVRFTHFRNNSRCCPTRATLMTGLPAHQTGIGHMTGVKHDFGVPSYHGAMNRSCVTIAEVLKPAGYATLMSGKWHLGLRDKSYWPLQRGFEKYYGCLKGASRYFHPDEITRQNEFVESRESTTDRPYYTTDAFTDHAIEFIEEETASETKRPFFLYLAYNAPHWPLQAHEEDIDKYRDTYSIGWDQLRLQRYQRQIELGLIDPRWKLSPRDEKVPAWDSLDAEQQKLESLRMAVYAAMVDRVDQNIGKLMKRLNEMGVAKDTLVMFLSDNGACQEGKMMADPTFADAEHRNVQPGIGTTYSRPWANASSTPFRFYKHHTYEGGAATPFIMHWPAGIKPQENWYASNGDLIDLMPTFIELSGASYPSHAHGNAIPKLPGISLVPAMKGEKLERESWLFNEHENNGLVIDGDWKLVANAVAGETEAKREAWELYNLKEDRTELHDLSLEFPERRKQMADAWSQWASDVEVFAVPSRRPQRHKNKKNGK